MDRPLQNRVRPDGAILAHPARGTLMGNRGGRLTDPSGALRRRWASPAWIACRLCFKGRRKDVTGPGYTALFFLDEATALAAGHRPCFECRRAEARAFAAAMAAGLGRPAPLRAPEIDRILHAERLGPLPEVRVPDLPAGAMVAASGAVFLVVGGGARRWRFEGYGRPEDGPRRARLLTPPAAVAALRAGYAPALHPSVFR
jgi:hypothetical protein